MIDFDDFPSTKPVNLYFMAGVAIFFLAGAIYVVTLVAGCPLKML